MAGGALLGAVVAPGFAAVTAVCVLLSLLYSHPAVRLKGVAGADLAVNMLGYGAGTTLAGFFAGQAAWGAAAAPPDGATWRLAAGFGLLFGSFYPLTQIYQIAPDRRRGDRTLAVRLGPRRALLLALALGAAAAPAFLGAASRWPGAGATGRPVPWLAFGMGLWLCHLAAWLARADRLSARQQEAGMYRALALWALVDAAVLAQRFLVGSGAGAAR
jgi:1,4-dihydroxy-2-naphthoate octaprenyltransferase